MKPLEVKYVKGTDFASFQPHMTYTVTITMEQAMDFKRLAPDSDETKLIELLAKLSGIKHV